MCMCACQQTYLLSSRIERCKSAPRVVLSALTNAHFFMTITSRPHRYSRFDTTLYIRMPVASVIYTTPWRGARLAPLALPSPPGKFAKAQGPPSKTTTSRNWSRECLRGRGGDRNPAFTTFPPSFYLFSGPRSGRLCPNTSAVEVEHDIVPTAIVVLMIPPWRYFYRGGCRTIIAREDVANFTRVRIYRPINSIARVSPAKRPWADRRESFGP